MAKDYALYTEQKNAETGKKELVDLTTVVNLQDSKADTFIGKYFAQQGELPDKVYAVSLGDNERMEKQLALLGNLINQDTYQSKKLLKEFTVHDKNNYVRLDQIEWSQFESAGLRVDYLMGNRALTDLLSYNKTEPLSLKIPFEGNTIDAEGRIYLHRNEQGNFEPRMIMVRNSLNLEKPYMGHTWTEHEKRALQETGHLGYSLMVKDTNGKEKEVVVSVDWKTNTLSSQNIDYITLPSKVYGRELSNDELNRLMVGRPVALGGLSGKNGDFYAVMIYDASERKLTPMFSKSQNQEQSQQQSGEKKVSFSQVAGVALTAEQTEQLSKGKAVWVEGMTNKKGEQWSSYVIYDKEKNRMRFSHTDPDKPVKTQTQSSKQTKEQKTAQSHQTEKKQTFKSSQRV